LLGYSNPNPSRLPVARSCGYGVAAIEFCELDLAVAPERVGLFTVH
jgi:hypothetical protein